MTNVRYNDDGRPIKKGTSKCAICHKRMFVNQLQNIGINGGFYLQVCKENCYTMDIKKRLLKYFGLPENAINDLTCS